MAAYTASCTGLSRVVSGFTTVWCATTVRSGRTGVAQSTDTTVEGAASAVAAAAASVRRSMVTVLRARKGLRFTSIYRLARVHMGAL